ncbi:MAG TPA: helix-turn-helix domain-containing protein [Candidatus Saccharimonadales bacterium]|nr:helix-turn-helix domain-containing protein [Candidatus Saccharimonadales bacterium]
MDKIIRDTLADLGLEEKEIRFFITNNQLGPSTINEITRIAKLERSTAYLIAQHLIENGYLIEDYKSYKKTLTTIEPKTLSRMLANRQRQLGRHERQLQENLAELEALHKSLEIRPRVRTYEGNKGLIAIWKDILETSDEVLLWTNQETEKNIFSDKYHSLFISERIKKKILMKVLAINNKKAKLLQKTDVKQLRKTKFLPKNVTFSAETYIYGNKVAILDYNKEIIGVILESEQIVKSHRAIFEMTWENLV